MSRNWPTSGAGRGQGRCLLLPKGNANLAAGCLLIGLRAAQVDDEAILGESEAGVVDRGKLRAAEGAGEADKNQGPVTKAQQRQATIRRMSLVRSGALPCWAVPIERRMPLRGSLTTK